ncbi:MAG: response regulator transcription factor [Pseudomonadota bacterium]
MKILLVDDHALFRAGMRYVLRELDEAVELLEAPDCDAAQRLADESVSLVLMDLLLPGTDGLRGLSQCRERLPDTPVVMLSAVEDLDRVERAMRLGARGYISKSANSDTMLGALRQVLAGEIYLPWAIEPARESEEVQPLTPRQIEVLHLLARGASNKEIARALGVAEGTVRIHVTAILRALNVRNRGQAAYAGVRAGLITEP